MSKNSPQHALWKGDFGTEYLKRNLFSLSALDSLYKKTWGVTRTAMNIEFFGKLKKDIKILEVGANFGMQLALLKEMGFENVYGVELNPEAVETSKKKYKGLNIVVGDALDLPFRDDFFDLVFTSGVLIHIGPTNRKKAMSEIYRCSRKYISGFEYFADRSTEIEYRGNRNVLWKAPFRKLYQNLHPDLKLVQERLYAYRDNPENKDAMFLLRKV